VAAPADAAIGVGDRAQPAAGLPDRLRGFAHRFSDPLLLQTALTHRSAGRPNNERFEFLGDAVLGLLVAELLHARHERASEGELTRLRAALVREESLAAIARELSLGEALRLGPGELRSGGHRRESILADAFEALLAAVYLDAGLDACRAALLPLLEPRLAALADGVQTKDPKTRLQEWLQGKGLALPHYSLVETVGDDHRKTFFVRCAADSIGIDCVGEGGSRRAAEAHAASLVLERIEAGDGGSKA
jgi:ribonuclease-3